MNKKHVLILCGGKSVEHEVSLCSARNIYDALDQDRFEATLILISKTGTWKKLQSVRELQGGPGLPRLESFDAKTAPSDSPQQALSILQGGSLDKIDVVFPIIHGSPGEDGVLQGLLRMLDLPFVGSDVLGSAVGMDKDVMKRLVQQAGLPTPKFVAVSAHEREQWNYQRVADLLGVPFFVKPANTGSSVGVAKVKSAADFQAAVETAYGFDHKILFEEAIRGRELECSVLGNDQLEASVVGEIIPHDDFYSYEAKYIKENGATLCIPAQIPAEISDQVRKLACRVFQILCCSGMGRVDFFYADDGRLLVNEINTIPGFTNISMYPQLWEASGLSYSDLITRLIELALERHERASQLTNHFDPAAASQSLPSLPSQG